MRIHLHVFTAAILAIFAAACATTPAAHRAPLALPPSLQGKAVVVDASDKDYERAELTGAVKPAGEGGITEGLVIRLTEDVPVWRMWSGPTKLDSRGFTNRIGQWWSSDAPHGAQADYRTHYEICMAWNDLTWVAQCTLKKGAVVAVGPGNSVIAKVCGDPAGKEEYPINDKDWQLWIAKAWARSGADKELDCPPAESDREADLADISKKKP